MSRVQHRFQISGRPEHLADRLRGLEWKVQDPEGDRLEARQGSQVTTRLLGGWFVNPSKLPKRLVAERVDVGMAVSIDESMGVGVMDPKMRRKYEEAFAELERQLTG